MGDTSWCYSEARESADISTLNERTFDHHLVTSGDSAPSDGFRVWSLLAGEGSLGPASRDCGSGPPSLRAPPLTLHPSPHSFTEKLLLKIVNNVLGGFGKLLNTLIRCTL